MCYLSIQSMSSFNKMENVILCSNKVSLYSDYLLYCGESTDYILFYIQIVKAICLLLTNFHIEHQFSVYKASLNINKTMNGTEQAMVMIMNL